MQPDRETAILCVGVESETCQNSAAIEFRLEIETMLDYDPKTNIRIYPLSMARFGQNPYGENLYRIVLGRSRRILGSKMDGVFKWVHAYGPEFDNQWILERWKSGFEITQMSPQAWNRSMQADVLGPYPDRGDYSRCEVQLSCSPVEANLVKLISWIEESRKRQMSASGPAENATALRDAYEAEKKAKFQKSYDVAYDACSSFLNNPFVSTSGSARSAKRGTKTQDFGRTANDLGLPTKSGSTFSFPTPKEEYKVRVEV